MIGSPARFVSLAVLVLVVGVIAHLVTLYLIPYVWMSRATASAAAQAGWNAPFYPSRANAESRTISRPSPDLLYTLCAYDVSEGALHVIAPVPKGTYWSVALYSDNTDNFFVVNDKQIGPLGQADFVLYHEGTTPPAGDLPKIKSPSPTGLVLFRTLISDEARLGELDAARRGARCRPYVPEPPIAEVPTPRHKPSTGQAAPQSSDEGTGQN